MKNCKGSITVSQNRGINMKINSIKDIDWSALPEKIFAVVISITIIIAAFVVLSNTDKRKRHYRYNQSKTVGRYICKYLGD